MGVMARGSENDITEERIAHILSEASHMMKPQQHDETHSNEDSKSPNHPQVGSKTSKIIITIGIYIILNINTC